MGESGEVRRDVYSLSDSEWNAFVAALQAIKASGIYDEFTRRHMNAMMELTFMPGETSTVRNVAHNGPSFFPWHRASTRELELELQKIDPTVFIPYWRWEVEGAAWPTAHIWDLVGGNGAAKGGKVFNGPFAGWTSIIYSNGTFVPRSGILRKFKTTIAMPLWANLNIGAYDVAPWNNLSSRTRSFRAAFEKNHNTVHTNIGGDMTAGTSPNDPIFYLHHANVDRAWATWQTQHGLDNFAPVSGGPEGHNIDDVLRFQIATDTTIRDTFDWRAMGYSYDTLES
jgi:tyrosinase